MWRSSTGRWMWRVWSRGRVVGFGGCTTEQEARGQADAVAAHYEEPAPAFELGEGIWGSEAPPTEDPEDVESIEEPPDWFLDL